MTSSLKQKVGAIIYDLPRFLWAMRHSSRHPWVLMRNRNEKLVRGGAGIGALCDWQWTSELHIANVFPSLGRSLMKRALRDWPINFRSEPLQQNEDLEVSFIIGHRGTERLPHLLLTLQSIAAQRGVGYECIVVEQSVVPEVKEHLPSWVRYVHTPLPYSDMPYCRAWSFNIGGRLARGEILVLHDNDLLVPAEYGLEIVNRCADGYEVVNLKRFIFFLSEQHSKRLLSGDALLLDEAPQSIMQNAEGGGSLAVSRERFFAMGGFDEAFVGWGGEDIEFWERAVTRSAWRYAYLPLIHLWHQQQPGKRAVNGNGMLTAALTEARAAIPADRRIEELRKREFGKFSGPWIGREQSQTETL